MKKTKTKKWLPEEEYWKGKMKKPVKNSKDYKFSVQIRFWAVKKGEKREKGRFIKEDKVFSYFKQSTTLPACLTAIDKVCYALGADADLSGEKAK